MRSAIAISGLVVTILVASAGAAVAAQTADDAMLKGLEDRGLKTLSDLYIRTKPAAPAAAPTGTAALPAGASRLDQAQAQEKQALSAKNVAERDEDFKSARTLYVQAIADAKAQADAIPQENIVDRAQARLKLLKMHEAFGNMLFLEWLKNDLDFLEVTDRRFFSSDRATIMDLLKTASVEYKDCLNDADSWLSAISHMDTKQRSPIVNAGIERQVKLVQKEVQYAQAWCRYYWGWVLPKDFKPAKGEETRADILNDAVTKFDQFTKMPDKVGQKWFSLMMTALAYRELATDDKGFDKALQALTMADGAAAPVAVRVRISYERAMTYLRKGDRPKAREMVDKAIAAWTDQFLDEKTKQRPVLTSDLFAMALPLVKAESFVAEGKAANNKALSDEGAKIFGDFAKRGNPWPVLVKAILDNVVGEDAASEEITKGDPSLMWMAATDAFRKAETLAKTDKPGDLAKNDKAAAAAEYKKAAAQFQAYATKVGPSDKDYDNAMKMAGHCLIQIGQKPQAVLILQKLAETAAKPDMALDAGRIVVSIRGEMYQDAQKNPAANSEADRAAYEQTIKWFLARWPAADVDQNYFLGNVLWVGKKYAEATQAFAKVPVTSEHYPDARYGLAMSGYDQFRAKVLGSADKAAVQAAAGRMAKELLAFGDYADSLLKKGGQSDDRVKLLNDQALATTMAAAETYLLSEVTLPQDALIAIGALKQRFGPMLTGDALGHVLLMEIISYQLLNQLDKAAGVLDDYLKVAKPEEVGPVLDGLFKAMIANVKDLIARDQKDQAATKVEQAKIMGDRLRDWLTKSKGLKDEDKAKQIETMRYDVAELILAVGKYDEALELYKAIGGPSPEDAKTTGGWLKEDCVYGQARAHEGLADAETDATRSRPHYEKAAAQWYVLEEITSKDRNADRQIVWERIYHFYYCRFKSGFAEEVAKGLATRETLSRPEPLGGFKDPALQAKFRDLIEKSSAAAGLDAPTAPAQVAPPAAAMTGTAATATSTAAPEAAAPAPVPTVTAPAAAAPAAVPAAAAPVAPAAKVAG